MQQQQKLEMAKKIDGLLDRGHKRWEIGRIGRSRRRRHADARSKEVGRSAPINQFTAAEFGAEWLDRLLDDGDRIRALTLLDPSVLFYVIEMAEAAFDRNPGALLFRDTPGRASDAGRRACIDKRHAILVYIMYAKTKKSQQELAYDIGVSQKTISRYVAAGRQVLSAVLPTPRNYEARLRACTDLAESKKMLPGPGRGAVIEDGTLCRIDRPGDKEARDESYNGRRKTPMANTLFRTNLRGEAVSMSKTVEGAANDSEMINLFELDLGVATANIKDRDAPADDRLTMYIDAGFKGRPKLSPGATVRRTAGRKEYLAMDDEGRARNKEKVKKRIRIEHHFGRMKRYRLVREPYGGTYDELNDDLNVVSGLVNMQLMGGRKRRGAGHAKKPAGERKRPHMRDLLAERKRPENLKKAGKAEKNTRKKPKKPEK